MNLQLDPSLLFAHKTQGGYSWTLVSRLGQMLRMAESLFGERDKNYTVLGIEFVGDNPRVWYPGNCGNVAIQLSTSAMNDVNQACYQLAHECIHLLSPSGGKGVNNLEEGLATYFASYYMKVEFGQPNWSNSEPKYQLAEQATGRLLAMNSSAIKTIRDSSPSFSSFTPSMLINQAPSLSAEDAKYLCYTFDT